jgi:outer membrane protein OmpA-like peptidoglycan-associated protein
LSRHVSVSWAIAFVLAASFLGACSQAALLRGRISGTREIVAEAERNGARHCAPRELAMAHTHLEFAEIESIQGNPTRAQEHFDIAEPNARAAVRLTQAERCLAQDEPAPLPPRPGDRDGDGITDDVDQCPDEPEDRDGHLDEDGCPETEDTDGDGIIDDSDLCPIEPEDRDDYLDTDGCPEPDNDYDQIADDADQCDNEPEDRDGTSDSDGCPDPDNDHDNFPDLTDRCPNEPGIEAEQGCPRVYQDVEITSTGIVIHQQIFFEFNRAVIQPQSFQILDTVAQVLRDFPDISIEVQGHTDSRGNDAFNLRLSQQRADAVRQYLINQGIASQRLTSLGYGETAPIESNATNDGRAMNRRVEFHRTDVPTSQR